MIVKNVSSKGPNFSVYFRKDVSVPAAGIRAPVADANGTGPVAIAQASQAERAASPDNHSDDRSSVYRLLSTYERKLARFMASTPSTPRARVRVDAAP